MYLSGTWPAGHRIRRGLAVSSLVITMASLFVASGGVTMAQGVVTLETPAPPGTQPSLAPGASPDAPADPEEAVLAYVQCMRDHGVDMPDPEFTADGGVLMTMGEEGEPGAGTGPVEIDEAFQEAQEACGDLMQGTMGTVDPDQQAQMQAQALAFAQCMRDHGIDMPDPEFDAGGGVSISVGGPGMPIDRDEMQIAQEACGGFMGGPGGPAPASPQAAP